MQENDNNYSEEKEIEKRMNKILDDIFRPDPPKEKPELPNFGEGRIAANEINKRDKGKTMEEYRRRMGDSLFRLAFPRPSKTKSALKPKVKLANSKKGRLISLIKAFFPNLGFGENLLTFLFLVMFLAVIIEPVIRLWPRISSIIISIVLILGWANFERKNG
jgi:hypothetical protein